MTDASTLSAAAERAPATLKNDTFLRALRREPTPYTPVWLMRQAGRYLPEYNATRARAGDFLTLCKTPELATEVTLQPLARFALDAAILFSDILTIPDAMGLGLKFEVGEGPYFERPLHDAASIERLAVPDVAAELGYVFRAVSEIKRALAGRVPLIGFSGSPFTLACYMIEGHGKTDFTRVKRMAYAAPELLKRVLEVNAAAVSAYLIEQVKAGADALMLFDTWGGLLSAAAYRDYSLAPMRDIVARVKAAAPETPIIIFTKGGGLWLEAIADSGCDAVGLDWTVDIGEARRRVGDRVALQGNLDPAVLFAEPARIRAEVKTILDAYGDSPGHVFNLGHGISQFTPPEHAAALIDAVHELSARR